ncbi:MAG TPA: DUF4920 domain-containing protein [Thermoanaerobaculia bacterium]|nr:DUF4920 domain-containing protein [Thermoanaerobaculia bacterium]
MKKLASALLVAFAAVSLSAGEVVTRGAAIDKEAKTVALATVLENPEAYTKDAVVVEGVIAAACTRKGCWMQLAPAADAKEGVRVTFKDYGFFIPLDAKGMKARAEGVAVVKTLSKAEADHLEQEGAKLTRKADGSALEVSFVANGVELTK